MPMMMLALLIAGSCGSGQMVNCGGLRGLPVLECAAATSCDLQFVADDWSGSGNWSARSGGWTATLTGSLTKTSSAVFPERSQISGFSNLNYFSTATDAAHRTLTTDELTYEFLIQLDSTTLATPENVVTVSNTGAAPTTYFRWTVAKRMTTELYLDATITQASTEVPSAGRYYLVTMTINPNGAGNTLEAYMNGVLQGSGTTTTTNSLLVPQYLRFGENIGGSNPFASGKILEIVRHRTKLDGATIAARAARFNAMKGY
jgi:hypothetical protein